jgi:hypothetical protein
MIALKLAGNGRNMRGARPGYGDMSDSDPVGPPAVPDSRPSVEDIISRVSEKRRS